MVNLFQNKTDLISPAVEVLNAIRSKVNAAIKEVADGKGLTIIVDKSVVPSIEKVSYIAAKF